MTKERKKGGHGCCGYYHSNAIHMDAILSARHALFLPMQHTQNLVLHHEHSIIMCLLERLLN